MVILIGGASCTGKTALAQKLMEQHHITYMSIDHVKMGIIRSNPNCGFSATDPEDKVTEHMWPVIREIIKTNIENDQNIIIEGCYLPCKGITEIEPAYSNMIIPFYIGLSEQYIRHHLEDGIIAYKNVIEYRLDDDYITADYFIKAHSKQKEQCSKYGLKYFEILSDYENEMDNVCKWADEQIETHRNYKFNR